MKKIIALTLILLALVAGYGFAQEEDSVPEEEDSLVQAAPAAVLAESSAVKDTSQWADLMQWRKWRDASLDFQSREMFEEAIAAAESSFTRSRAIGLDLPVDGAYWGAISRQAMKKGDWDKAQSCINLALLADKYSFKNFITKFQINKHFLGFVSSLGQIIQTARSYKDDFRFSFRFYEYLLFFISLTLAAGTLFFLLLLAAKYLPYYFHLAADMMPRGWPYFSRMFLVSSTGIGIFLLAASYSTAIAIIVLAGFVSVMASTREKVMFWVSIGLLGISSAGFNLLHQYFAAADRGRIEMLIKADTSDWDVRLAKGLSEQQQLDPSDLKPVYALSLMEKNRGSLDRAKTYLSAIIDASGNNPIALNNMGNMHFFEGNYDSAENYYRRAIEADEGLAVAHYNLGQVYFKRIDFNQARAELEKASALAPAMIESRNRESRGNMVMDARLNSGLLWSEFIKGWKATDSFTPGELRDLALINLWLPAWLWLGLLVLLIGWFVVMKNNLTAANCILCGRFVCLRCQAMGQDGNLYCQGCNRQIFSIQSSELQQRAAEGLSRKAPRRENIIIGLANFILPGSVFVAAGETIKGWLFAMILGSVYAGAIFINSSWITFKLGVFPGKGFYMLAGIAVLIMFLITWMAYMRKLKNQGESHAS